MKLLNGSFIKFRSVFLMIGRANGVRVRNRIILREIIGLTSVMFCHFFSLDGLRVEFDKDFRELVIELSNGIILFLFFLTNLCLEFSDLFPIMFKFLLIPFLLLKGFPF